MSTNNEDKLILGGRSDLLPVLFWDPENFLWIW